MQYAHPSMNIRIEFSYISDRKKFPDPRKFTFRQLVIFLTHQITKTLFLTFSVNGTIFQLASAYMGIGL